MGTIPETDQITIEEVAIILNRKIRRCYDYIKSGKIKKYSNGLGEVRYSREEVMQLKREFTY